MTRRQRLARGFFAAWCALNIVLVPATQLRNLEPAAADIPIVQNTVTISTAGSGTFQALPLTGQSICWVSINAGSTLSGGGVINPQVSSNGGNDWVTATTVSGGSMTLAAGAQNAIGNIATVGTTAYRLNVSGTVSGTGSVTYGCTPSVGGLTFAGQVGISGTAITAITSGTVAVCTSGGLTCITPIQATSGTNFGLPTFQSSTGLTYPINCELNVSIGTGSSAILVSATAGKTIYVCAYGYGINAASGSAQLSFVVSGTACTGSNAQIGPRVEGGTAILFGNYVTAGTGVGTLYSNNQRDLCIIVAGSVSAIGSVRYSQF